MTTTEPNSEAIESFARLSGALNANFYERRDEIQCLLAGLVARQHLLLLGPPGTAKSLLVQAFSKAFGDRPFFDKLMTRFTEPSEVFGPTDIQTLKTSGRQERLTQAYLPTASFAFLDEVFKSNSAILNSLLRMVNERKFQNGSRMESVPLEMVVGASNELPQDSSLDAFYDRFALRCWVTPLRDQGNWERLMMSGGAPEDVGVRIPVDHLDSMRKSAEAVDLSGAIPAISAIRSTLGGAGIVSSDRRWVACTKLVRASAALRGSPVADGTDCAILQHALWDQPEDIPLVFKAVISNIDKDLTRALELHDVAKESFEKVDFSDDTRFIKTASNANEVLRSVMGQLTDLNQTEAVRSVRDDVVRMTTDIKNRLEESLNF